MKATKMRVLILAMTTVMALLSAAACGGGSEGSGQTDRPDQADQATEVTVGLLPIIDVAPVHLGIEKGFFAEEGLEVNIQTATSGSATLAAVVAGDTQFAGAAVLNVMQATEQGLALQAVVNGQFQTPADGSTLEGRPSQALFVAPDSAVQSPEDLAGKTIAINALGSLNEMFTRNALDQVGVESEEVQFIELPQPAMPDALLAGQVDAAVINEPFATIAESRGATSLLSPFAMTDEPLCASVYVTSMEFAAENPDVVEGFQIALNKANQYAAEHEDEVRNILASYTEIDQETLENVVLPFWGSPLSLESVEEQAELGVRYGLLSDIPPGLEDVFGPAADN